MSREHFLRCEICRDQFLNEPVRTEYNENEVNLCSFSCFVKYFARIYHQAMASGATVQVTMKGEKQ